MQASFSEMPPAMHIIMRCYTRYDTLVRGGEDGDFLDVILQDLRSCRRIVNAFGGMLN